MMINEFEIYHNHKSQPKTVNFVFSMQISVINDTSLILSFAFLVDDFIHQHEF